LLLRKLKKGQDEKKTGRLKSSNIRRINKGGVKELTDLLLYSGPLLKIFGDGEGRVLDAGPQSPVASRPRKKQCGL